jgi:hypothetical protein
MIFVEDSGAANYLFSLPESLTLLGISVTVIADGCAVQYLSERGIKPTTAASYKTSKCLIDTFKPDLIIIGTSENKDTMALDLVLEARRLDITTLGAIDAVANSALRFRGHSDEPLFYAPDWLAVPDELTRTKFIELGFNPQKVIICGHPHFDYIRKKASDMALLSPESEKTKVFGEIGNRKVITFATEKSTGLDSSEFQKSEQYSLIGWGKKNERTAIVIEEFLNAVKLITPQPYLVLRIHPADSLDNYLDYINLFDTISQTGSSLKLIYVSDVVVGMTSMILLEAALMGKRTLSIIPRELEKEWLPSIDANITLCSWSTSDIKLLLEKCLRANSIDEDVLTQFFPFNSTERVAELVCKLLKISSEDCNGNYS